jgi:8-oxo-dGTP pyrophosphatase MutT (NUDIX family)
MKKNRVRSAAKAIIVEAGKLLVLKMEGVPGEGPWYALPGGGQKAGETLEEALRRECLEELGLEVEVGPLRFVRDYIASHHEFATDEGDAHQVDHLFTCTILRRAAESGPKPDQRQLDVAWLPVKDLENYPLWPKVLRHLIRCLDLEPHLGYLGDVN